MTTDLTALASTAHLVGPGETAAFLTRRDTVRWVLAPHLQMISDAIVDACVRGNGRLIVAAPPRHGKTELLSHWLPAWFLSLWPERRVILASYAAELATKNGRLVRNTVQRYTADPNALLGLQLADDSKAADRWNTQQGGGLLAAGAGGGITGWGAHLLIIDDPFKNAEEAASEVMRDRVWRWWQMDASTRLEPGGTVVLIATRWHEDDLTGRLIADAQQGGQSWDVLNLRAVAEDDDPLGRPAGAPLWPERYDLDALAQIRRTVGSYGWNALFQQRPSSAEGALVKREWWRYDEQPVDVESLDQVLWSWDLTFGASAGSDFVAGHVWGRKGATYHLLDRVHERLDAPGQMAVIRAGSQQWPQATAKLVERAANADAVISLLADEVSGLIPVPARGSKEHRLAWATNAAAPLIEAGNVHLPRYLPRRSAWVAKTLRLEADMGNCVPEIVDEFASFPKGAHDDDVDAATQALSHLSRYGRQEVNRVQAKAQRDGIPPRSVQEWQRQQRAAILERERRKPNRTVAWKVGR